MMIVFIVIQEFQRFRRLKTALILVLFFGVISNFTFFSLTFYFYKVERTEMLHDHLYAQDENWVGIGKKLNELFSDTDVLLGICAAGAIPYYSEMVAVDFMGLTDKYVPEIGDPFSSMAGHRIMAPLEYAVNRKVNLIIQPISLMMTESDFHNWKRNASWKETKRFLWKVEKPVNGRLIDEVNLLRIPIANGYSLILWYLTPHEAVEKAILERGLEKVTLVRI